MSQIPSMNESELRSQRFDMEPRPVSHVSVPVGYYHQLVAFYERYKGYVHLIETQDKPPAPESKGAEEVAPSQPDLEELLRVSRLRETPVPAGAIPRGAAARKMQQDGTTEASSGGGEDET